jgi:hypothetical protein
MQMRDDQEALHALDHAARAVETARDAVFEDRSDAERARLILEAGIEAMLPTLKTEGNRIERAQAMIVALRAEIKRLRWALNEPGDDR